MAAHIFYSRQDHLLREYLLQKGPIKIALDFSQNSNLADCLTHGMYLSLLNHLNDTPFAERFISSEEIVQHCAEENRKRNYH